MGMFFNDDTEKKNASAQKPKSSGILDGIVEAILFTFKAILTALLTALLWLGKKIFGQYFETLKHLLDFRGVEKEVAKRRIVIALLVVAIFPGIPLFYLYKKPVVRDYLTLSQTTTVNVLMPDARIFFPDRSYFVPEEKRRVLDFRAYGAPGLYLSYPLHEEGSMYIVNDGDCQLVTRALPISILSKNFPKGAEGFRDTVTYYVTYNVDELSGKEYLLEFLYNPRYVWKSKAELAKTSTTFSRTKPWEELHRDWSHLERLPSGNKAFTIKARTDQYAIICS